MSEVKLIDGRAISGCIIETCPDRFFSLFDTRWFVGPNVNVLVHMREYDSQEKELEVCVNKFCNKSRDQKILKYSIAIQG